MVRIGKNGELTVQGEQKATAPFFYPVMPGEQFFPSSHKDLWSAENEARSNIDGCLIPFCAIWICPKDIRLFIADNACEAAEGSIDCKITVTKVGSKGLVINTDFGLAIEFDGQHKMAISLPNNIGMGNTEGWSSSIWSSCTEQSHRRNFKELAACST